MIAARLWRSRALWRGFFIGLFDTLLLLTVALLLTSTAVRDGAAQGWKGLHRLFQRETAVGYDGLGVLYAEQFVTQGSLHGLNGWQGVDVKGSAAGTCNYDIHAPFNGTVTYNGLDGYNHRDDTGKVWPQATMLTLESSNGRWQMTLLHGNYDRKLVPGTAVRQGQVIGRAGSHGWSTGCHDHVIFEVDGQLVNWLDYAPDPTRTTAALGRTAVAHNGNPSGGAHGTVLGSYEDVALRASYYIPALGGTNCDHDCSTMASGDKVDSWLGGRPSGLLVGYATVYAAACPQEWGHGTRFTAGGKLFECRDRGGWINCYASGDYDPAMKRVAERPYCWIDTLGQFEWAYGELVTDWGFVR